MIRLVCDGVIVLKIMARPKFIVFVSIAVCLQFISTVAYSQINVAIGKPVTVDSEDPDYPAWKAVEGLNYSNANRWVSDNQGYPHWIEVDLQANYNIEKIIYYVGEYGTNHPVYDYSLQYWSGSGWSDIVSHTGNNNPEITEIFDPVNTSKIRLYATSGEGSQLMLYEIEVYASFNQQPSIDRIDDPAPVYFDAQEQTVHLSGISPGNAETQNLTITATSSDNSVVASPQISYAQGDTTASLLWTPAGTEGSATITVTVQDDGGRDAGGVDTVSTTFHLTLRDPSKNYPPTIEPVTDVHVFANSSLYNVVLKNISDGDSNREQTLAVSAATESDLAIVENLMVNYPAGSDEAVLSFNSTETTGTEIIRVVLRDDGGTENGGTDSAFIEFNVISTLPQDAVQVILDLEHEYQEIDGFGGFGYEKVTWARPPYYTPEFVNEIVDDLGLTILRVSIETFLEPENENDDPEVLDLDKYRSNLQTYGAASFFPFLKDLNEKAPVKIIASVWTPPAWMKTNNSEIEGGNLRPEYYEEFAEYIVAYIKLLKEQTGVDLYAVSLQNEPTFREPYESCQYTPRTYCNLISVVGKRFEKENISTKLFYPEEVFVRDYDIYPWLDTLNNDPTARKYVDIMALHGYDFSGVSAGSIGNDLWESYRNELADFPAHPKKLWVTETSGQPNTLEGALRMAAGLSNAIKYGKLNAWVFWTISGEATDPENPENVYNLMFIGHKLKKYYASKQYYRYVRPGAVSVGISSSDIDILSNAFVHKQDSTLTYIFINRSGANKILNFKELPLDAHAQAFRTSATENCEPVPLAGTRGVMIPAKSILTIVQSTKGLFLLPTINQVSDTLLFSSSERIIQIHLSGISDGVGGDNSTLSFSVKSSNISLVKDSVVNFNPVSSEAELLLVKDQSMTGESNITLTLTREPSDIGDTITLSKEMNFNISIIDYLNNPPDFTIEGRNTVYLLDGPQNISITDIEDGNPEIEENLVFSYTNGNNAFFTIDQVNYAQGESTADLVVTPKKAGTESIMLKLTDDGENLVGKNSVQKAVLIRVMDGTSDVGRTAISGPSVYPLPADSYLNITKADGFDLATLIDPSGTVLVQRKVTNGSLSFYTGNIGEGFYFLKLTGVSRESRIFKIIIVHE